MVAVFAEKMTKDSKSTDIATDLKIRLIPKSSRNEIVGRDGETYRIKLTAPPVDGKANRAMLVFLSKKLKIPRTSMEIVRGEKSRDKTVRVTGIAPDKADMLLDVK
jgi:uncharacterized protein (TIGR00251 family)